MQHPENIIWIRLSANSQDDSHHIRPEHQHEKEPAVLPEQTLRNEPCLHHLSGTSPSLASPLHATNKSSSVRRSGFTLTSSPPAVQVCSINSRCSLTGTTKCRNPSVDSRRHSR